MLADNATTWVPSRRSELGEARAAAAPALAAEVRRPRGRYLPHVLVTTFIVLILPPAASVALRSFGVISSVWLSTILAVALSLSASIIGSAYWRKRGDAGEALFSELLPWGWIRRWRQDREVARAVRLLNLVDPTLAARGELSVERREQLLRRLADALDGQDAFLSGHSHRVARHATMIARGLGLGAEEVARIRAAAAVHDVGKLFTPSWILNKPGRLSDAEYEVIKRHPVAGADMVAALGDPELTRIVRHHHERLDGAGYPDGLAGEEIPLGARIIAVADTFDAITSARPYRPASRHQVAIDILRREAGSQLDPEAVRAFLAYYSGRRPTIACAVVTAAVRRALAWLTGDPASAAVVSAGKVATATAVTAVLAAAAPAAVLSVSTSRHARHGVTARSALAARSAPARPSGRALVAPRTPAPQAPAPTPAPRPGAAHPAGAPPAPAPPHVSSAPAPGQSSSQHAVPPPRRHTPAPVVAVPQPAPSPSARPSHSAGTGGPGAGHRHGSSSRHGHGSGNGHGNGASNGQAGGGGGHGHDPLNGGADPPGAGRGR